MTTINLATCSWREVTPEMGVPVAISVGKPRRPLFSFETVNDLAPYGLLGRKDLTDAEWRDAYLYRVERRATRIADALDELGAKYQGSRLVLLCWERLDEPGTWCHRRMAADWLGDRLDTTVQELGATPTDCLATGPGEPDGAWRRPISPTGPRNRPKEVRTMNTTTIITEQDRLADQATPSNPDGLAWQPSVNTAIIGTEAPTFTGETMTTITTPSRFDRLADHARLGLRIAHLGATLDAIEDNPDLYNYRDPHLVGLERHLDKAVNARDLPAVEDVCWTLLAGREPA